LVKPIGALCASCHRDPTLDLGGVAKTTIHGPLNTGGCTLCHDAHGGPGGTNLRMPEGELCQSCHEPYTPKELGRLGARIHAPVARGECSACHEPHASRGKALLKDTGNALCRRCHDPARHSHALAPRGTSGFATVPADWPRDGAQFSCTGCHRPHSSPTPRLFTRDRAELCKTCHKGS
jgi:predicted CXXCH cytochrome family protein